MGAIANANQNVGGDRLAIGEQSFDIRGIGLVKTCTTSSGSSISEQQGTPVRVGDVADRGDGPCAAAGHRRHG